MAILHSLVTGVAGPSIPPFIPPYIPQYIPPYIPPSLHSCQIALFLLPALFSRRPQLILYLGPTHVRYTCTGGRGRFRPELDPLPSGRRQGAVLGRCRLPGCWSLALSAMLHAAGSGQRPLLVVGMSFSGPATTAPR